MKSVAKFIPCNCIEYKEMSLYAGVFVKYESTLFAYHTYLSYVGCVGVGAPAAGCLATVCFRGAGKGVAMIDQPIPTNAYRRPATGDSRYTCQQCF